MIHQGTFEFSSGRKLPVTEIIKVILDRGHLTKDDIRLLWDLSEDEYAQLKERLADEKLIEPGARGAGGFLARFNKNPDRAAREEPKVDFKNAFEREAAERLVALLSHKDFEDLLGDLVYTIRRARQKLTNEDRRGTKLELAAALLTQHGIDLFAPKDVRGLIAKRAKVASPGRWHPGKGAALRFVDLVGFPVEYAGIPAAETPADFEYLEGRVHLHGLQDFQLEVQKKLRKVLEKPGSRAIVTLPTGGGKTRVAVDTIRDWLTDRFRIKNTGHGNVVLWLAHTDELCEQAYACFREVWTGSSNVCPMMLFRFWGQYTRDLKEHQESLQTLAQRPSVLVSTPHRIVNLIEGNLAGGEPVFRALKELVGLVVIDEAHRAAAPSYRRIMQEFKSGAATPAIAGLTATPFRNEYSANDPIAGTVELRDLFASIIEPIETLGEDPRRVLQDRGYLAKPIFDVIKTATNLRAPAGVDLENPSEDDIERIDYALKIRADSPDRRLIVLERLRKICKSPDALVIYFGPTVQDAECMAFLLRQYGIEAAFVSGETRDVTRRRVISEFKEKRIQVLCNCEVLTTGFDAPRVTHVVLARPTVSQVLYEQMVGRGLRGLRFGGTETCHVIDLEDNYRSDRPELGYKRFREIWAPK